MRSFLKPGVHHFLGLSYASDTFRAPFHAREDTDAFHPDPRRMWQARVAFGGGVPAKARG